MRAYLPLLRTHNIVGFLFTLWLIPLLLSALVMLLPSIFRNIDFNRNSFGESYSFQSWKNLPFTSSKIINNKLFIYGKAGIFYSSDSLKTALDYSDGLPGKAYKREVNSLSQDSLGTLWAATNNGAYFKTEISNRWEKYHFIPNEKVVHITCYKGYMMVFFMNDRIIAADIEEVKTYKPTSTAVSRYVSIKQLLKDIHSGALLNSFGRGIIVIFCLISLLLIAIYYVYLFKKLTQKKPTLFILPLAIKRIALNKILLSIFFITVLLFSLGFIVLNAPGINLLNHKVAVARSENLNNIKSATYYSLINRFVIVDNDGIFLWDIENPERLVPVLTKDHADRISYIKSYRNKIYACTNQGIYTYLPLKRQAKLIDPRPSIGLAILDTAHIWSISSSGVTPLWDGKPFNPTISTPLFSRISAVEIASFIHSGKGYFFISPRTFQLINAIWVGTFIFLLVVGIWLRKKGTF
jgi:hypothetical protein